jgi:hypothetical protein
MQVLARIYGCSYPMNSGETDHARCAVRGDHDRLLCRINRIRPLLRESEVGEDHGFAILSHARRQWTYVRVSVLRLVAPGEILR